MTGFVAQVAYFRVLRTIPVNVARPLAIVARVAGTIRRIGATSRDVARFAAFVAGRIVWALLAIFCEMTFAVTSRKNTFHVNNKKKSVQTQI